MKKTFSVFILSLILLLTACDSENGTTINQSSLSSYPVPSSGYRYISHTDCTNGMLYKYNNCLCYYGYVAKTHMSFCSDPSCEHRDNDCSAYYPGRVFIKGDKIIEIGNEDEWSETDGYKEYAELSVSDFSGYNRRTVKTLDYAWGDTYAYGDKLYIACLESYYEEGDDLFCSSDKARVFLMEMSLETFEVVFLSDCLVDGYYAGIAFMGINNGKLYFETRECEGAAADEFGKYVIKNMSLNLDTKEICAEDERLIQCLDKCNVYYDNNTVSFVSPDKTVELTSSVYSEYMPISIEQELNGEVYFMVFGSPNSIFKFVIEDETLYEAQSDRINTKIYVITSEGIVIADTDTQLIEGVKQQALPIFLNNADLVYKKIDSVRYDEVVTEHNIACKDEKEAYEGIE